jgi:hypothetical protein
MIDLAPGTWIPIVLHTSWEQDDDFRALRRLAERIAPYAADWGNFLAEVDRSAGAAASERRAAMPGAAEAVPPQHAETR